MILSSLARQAIYSFFICIVSLQRVQSHAVNDVAFVIPVHYPKFQRMADFLDSYTSTNVALSADVAAVFSHEKDSIDFLELHRNIIPHKVFKSLVYDGSFAKHNMNPVFYKKWWAIYKLVNDYDYFFLVDSEIKIVKSFDAKMIASTIHYRKILYGSEIQPHRVSFYSGINANSMMAFREDDKQKLLLMNKGNLIYFWYNEIPVVEAATAKRYLDYISFEADMADTKANTTSGADIASSNVFANHGFDYISYAYYCLLYEDFALLEVGYLGHGLGASFGDSGGGSATLLRITHPHWASEGSWLQSREKFDNVNIVMLFHCDRHNHTNPKTLRPRPSG